VGVVVWCVVCMFVCMCSSACECVYLTVWVCFVCVVCLWVWSV